MFVYEPSAEHDHYLRQWFRQMQQDDDLTRTFGQGISKVDEILDIMQEPTTGYLEVDADGPWFVGWIVPAGMSGVAYFNLWVRNDQRHKHAVASIYQMLKCAFSVFRVILVVTKQDRLAENSTRFGFTHLGVIPEIFDGQAAHVLYFTRDGYARLVADVESRLARH